MRETTRRVQNPNVLICFTQIRVLGSVDRAGITIAMSHVKYFARSIVQRSADRRAM